MALSPLYKLCKPDMGDKTVDVGVANIRGDYVGYFVLNIGFKRMLIPETYKCLWHFACIYRGMRRLLGLWILPGLYKSQSLSVFCVKNILFQEYCVKKM